MTDRTTRNSIPQDGFDCIYLYENGHEVGCLNGPQSDPDVIARAEHWSRTAARPDAGYAVKALEWEQPDGPEGTAWLGHGTDMCQYYIRFDSKTASYWMPGERPMSEDDDSGQEFFALDDAKAAAQADYEQRIRSALLEQPATPDAYRDVIDEALVVRHIGVASGDAKADLNKLLDWEVGVALDPAVSEKARDLIEQGRKSTPGYAAGFEACREALRTARRAFAHIASEPTTDKYSKTVANNQLREIDYALSALPAPAPAAEEVTKSVAAFDGKVFRSCSIRKKEVRMESR
jgi:hypothetical protein